MCCLSRVLEKNYEKNKCKLNKCEGKYEMKKKIWGNRIVVIVIK